MTTNSVQLITIEAEYQGQRIDNFLINFLKGVPKTHIYRLLRKGEVRVNKGRAQPQYRLEVGDVVRVPPVRYAPAKTGPETGHWLLEKLKDSIIYEDSGLLAINKPSGIAVHGGSGVTFGVIEGLRALYPLAKRLELVHRLDRDTSGCLLIAKKATVLKELHEALRGNEMDKYYVALIKGQLRKGTVVDQPLRKNTLRSGERIVVIDHEQGKQATTVFSPNKIYEEATLVDVKLLTGRTHQIRVHSQYLGQPIAGDEKYGDDDFNKAVRRLGLNRLFLHAKRLSFVHPQTGHELNLEAPLDSDLEKFLKKLSPAHG